MNNSIGKQILKLRKEKNVSQTDLANFLGIQSQTVSKWEREVCVPDIAKLPQIAVFFGITLDELFDFDVKNVDKEIEEIRLAYNKYFWKNFEKSFRKKFRKSFKKK